MTEDADLQTAFDDWRKRRALIRQLVTARRKANVTQAQVAAALHISQPAVAQFESGSDPQVTTMQRYARALGLQMGLSAMPLPDPADDAGLRSDTDAGSDGG